MKVKQLSGILFLFSLLWLASCKKDEQPAGAGHYTEGVFVVNEGPFGGTGTITWHNPRTGETVQDVFGLANGGAVLGQFVQSLTLHNGKAYVVVNGANKVYVVDAVTFVYLDTIGGLAQPRHLLPVRDQYAYLSQWGADGLSGSVVKIDLSTNKVVKTIPAGHGPEKLHLALSGALWAPNSGGYGLDSTITSISLATDAVNNTFSAGGKNPCCIQTGQGAEYALCKGDWLAPDDSGYLVELGAGGTSAFPLPQGADDLSVSPDGQTFYFTSGGSIWSAGPSGPKKWLDQPAYGLGCDPLSGNLYCADAKDFNSVGEVVIYKPSGEKVGGFPVGIAPGEVVFIR